MGVELFPRSNVEIQTITHLVLFKIIRPHTLTHGSFFYFNILMHILEFLF